MSMEPPPPPPPPPSGPSYGAPGSQPVSIGDAVSYGWGAYWKNVGPMVVIVLIIVAIEIVFSLIGSAFNSVVAQIFFGLIGWLLGLFLGLGLFRVSLAITRGERPEVSEVFRTEGYGPYIVASIVFGIGFYIGLILCIIPGIIFAVVFGFYGFVAAEQGNAAVAMDTLRRAAEITRGHRWQLFGLAIVLALINLVGALLCGVGLLFTAGITLIAWAYTYRRISGEPIEYAAWGL
ncbi:MAG TPA: hypothetical protein VH986_02875 [Acidimicrobiia bacterium]|jgi:uncharacterized membrane protein